MGVKCIKSGICMNDMCGGWVWRKFEGCLGDNEGLHNFGFNKRINFGEVEQVEFLKKTWTTVFFLRRCLL